MLRHLKNDARTRAIPVVIMTSSREERDMINGYQLGVNSYIQKPVDFAEFREIIKQLGLYWLVVNQAPPSQRIQIPPGVSRRHCAAFGRIPDSRFKIQETAKETAETATTCELAVQRCLLCRSRDFIRPLHEFV